MKRRVKLYAKWLNPGDVDWQVYGLGGGWSVWGHFSNCVSRRCVVERVRRIIKAPREPPRRIYNMADVALDHLVGMIGDFKLDSYEVKLGVDIGAGEAYRLERLVYMATLVYELNQLTAEMEKEIEEMEQMLKKT